MIQAIFDYMDAKGIRYSWLAKQLDISTSRLSRIKKGERPAPKGFVASALTVLGIDLLGHGENNVKDEEAP